MAYKTMNTRFEERLLLFMAYGTRNLTFEARFFLLVLKERGKLHLKLACFVYGLYNEEYYI